MEYIRQLSYNVGSYFYNSFSSHNFHPLKPFDITHPVFIFGLSYTHDTPSELSFADAAHRIHDLITITYRQKYATLGHTYLTSDAGWGCAIRSVQMLLVNSIVVYLDKSFHPEYTSHDHIAIKNNAKQLVFDKESSVLSIHNIYIQDAIIKHNPTGTNFLPPSTCATAVADLYNFWEKRTFDVLMCTEYIPEVTQPTLLFIPRIVTKSERNFIQTTSFLPQSRGFVAGIGDAAIYCFGVQEKRVFFLDPHFVQDASEVGYFNRPIFEANFDELDNSFVFGMMCENKSDCEVVRMTFNMGKEKVIAREMNSTENIKGFEVLNF
ncbi:hypothetical protein EIN_056230 [Entamoeba invadens IP1]|uniref:hypothetical protein n=1 Tax=Entamoeba invadens IP1 TaxID=370355 RepID=UPI0002C3EBCA|nr:hypothetical protein EIN_056230 [Entamoeba invadens IP1]ELP93248.1 hypothetical protein EIN_056230 [Entamoeba invadens IP1]|eukprot:XP_004260019.1 hypothetical protein EIN_056230 [Entamoeba invadens IP1]